MIKVMIAEDEPPILRDVKHLVESADPDFKVTACAYNGHQAMAVLETDLPDILITDIQMPAVDGLELIAHIRERHPGMIAVILSGYSEFEYAKKAVKLGVTDYLLKPVDPDELSRLLSRLKQDIIQNKSAMERNYLSDIVSDSGSSGAPGSRKPACSSYLLMLFCAGAFPVSTIDDYGHKRKFWKTIDLEEAAAKDLEEDEAAWAVDGKTGAEKLLVLTLNRVDDVRVRKLAENIASSLHAASLTVNIAVSPVLGSIEEIGAALNNLRAVLRKKLVLGKPGILFSGEDTPPHRAPSCETLCLDPQTESKIALFVQQGNILSLKHELKKLLKQWEAAHYPQLLLEKLLRELIFLCQRHLSGATAYSDVELELDIMEAVSSSNSCEELYHNVCCIFDNLFDIRSSKCTEKDSMQVLMQKIDNYIRTNLAESISHQKLSEMFGLVPSYLSKLFKQYKGMSPSDYLVSLRVEQARELIHAHPELHAKDVASMVGYSDPLYFSKIFKKETGMSPSEFRNKARQ